MPTRHVILTLGEVWPMGQILIGPVEFDKDVPVFKSWEDKEVTGWAELVLEGKELVTYTDIPFHNETHFVSCGIKTELNFNEKDEVEMVDCKMIGLFIAPRI